MSAERSKDAVNEELSDNLLRQGESAWESGDLVAADLFCRSALDLNPGLPGAYCVIASIAQKLGLSDQAIAFADTALKLEPEFDQAVRLRRALQAGTRDRPADPEVAADSKRRYLLIKAWGYGFWSDMDHVLSSLLLAEMTGRVPVVHWGERSLFGGAETDNAFENFFLPVSDASPADLLAQHASYFPEKWHRENVLRDDPLRDSKGASRVGGIRLLNRPEDVVVSESHTRVIELLPWTGSDHPAHGRSIESVYRYLWNRYITLLPDLAQEIDEFAARQFTQRPLMAVHLRGSDKVVEVGEENLDKINGTIGNIAEQFLGTSPAARLFVLTDSETILSGAAQRFGDRMIATDAIRTGMNIGLHHQPQTDRRRLGMDVIRDACLAARCDFVVGAGITNVYRAISYLKDWPPDHAICVGPNKMHMRLI